MLIFALFTKLVGLYSASHFFSAIGGAYSMDSSLGQSAYDALANQGSNYRPEGQYSPPVSKRYKKKSSSSSSRKLQESDEEDGDNDQDDIGPRVSSRPGVF
eukprot:CAMPEP_0174817810 /NCGR_PEP_ID=MMETSP1107-20130205/363_1 /TAXON_ID=36770 /ORGANISM="Paraphysomonas vestita, Strain GFlagA" /LENGTH=100 /DNA_ID=CAMNT_0016028863 /DNA_START=303 /DNA_END=605 /DNA_ORIENTATION=+